MARSPSNTGILSCCFFSLFQRNKLHPCLVTLHHNEKKRLCVIHGKLRDVFVHTPTDNHPGLSPVFLQRIDLDFIP